MMKKWSFVIEYLLLQGIDNKRIFIMQVSQIMKHKKITTFCNIDGMSQKPTCVVVFSKTAKSLVVSLPESLSLIMMGDSMSPFRKA
jgi:hypothetical protein